MLRSIRLLNLRPVRRRPLRSVIAMVSVAAGVSLAVSVVVLTTSTSASLAEFGRHLAGPTPLRIVGATSRGGLAESVLGPVERTPGVAAAVPLVQAVTYAEDTAGHQTTVVALGAGCRSQALFGPSGCSPTALGAARVDSPPLISEVLARSLGGRAVLRTDQGRTGLDRAGVVRRLDAINHGHVVVFPLRVAQQLFDRPQRLDAIYVQPASGTSVVALRRRLQTVVGGWNGVLGAADAPPGAVLIAGIFVPLFTLLSLFALGVGGVLVFNTMALSLEDRRRDLAVVGALGGTAATVVGGTLAEATVLGLVGGILGTAGGVGLAHPLAASVSDFTKKFVGAPVTVHLAPFPLVFGAVLGAVVAAGAAWVPARRAARIDVAAELSRRELRAETRSRSRLLRGTLAGGIGLVGIAVCWAAQRHGGLQPWQASVAPVGVLISSVGFLLAIGAVAALCAGAVRALVGDAGGATRLGVANLIREPGRTGVMAIAVGSAVAIAFLIASSRHSIHDAIARGIASGNPHEVHVSTLPPNNDIDIDAKPPPALEARLAAFPGVASVDRGAALLTGHDDANLVGVSAYDHPWFPFPLIAGTRGPATFARGQVLVGVALARSHHLRPGSRLRLDTPTGFATVTVGGIWGNGNFNGKSVDMPMSLFRQLYGNQPSDGVGLIASPGVPVGDLAARIRAAGLDPDLRVDTPDELSERVSRDVTSQLAPFEALQRGLLVVGFVAVLSTLLLVGVQRRRELGLLAAVGMEPVQLAGMTLVEAGAVGVIAVALSVVGAIGMSIAFYFVVPIIIGFHDPLRLDFASLLLWGPVAVGMVLAAAALPAWRTSRLEVREALQYE